MTRAGLIADQLQRSYAGQAWHGPSLQELLTGVTAEEAQTKPIPGAHSIWELVEHVRAWNIAALRRMGGDPANLSTEEDWPGIGDRGDAAWKKALAALASDHDRLRAAAAALADPALDAKVAGAKYSVGFLLHGVIQHNLYHAGQIALLKRATANPSA